MSRPSILSVTGSQFKIEVPLGWSVTINAISRKTYNQLVTCAYSAKGHSFEHSMVNQWYKPNQMMLDTITSEDVITIIPQDEVIEVDVNVYFSTKTSVKGEALKGDQYRSSRLNVSGTHRPPNAPKDIPDYSTFLIFVEDSVSTKGPEYDDSLITINLIGSEALVSGGVTPTAAPVPLDTGSKGLLQSGKEAIDNYINMYTDPSKSQGGPVIPLDKLVPDPLQPASPLPVCIIGAGVSGLYIAMMLQSLGIKYEIMEGSGRTGGRLHTYNFPKNPGKYQYYDIGAMRYPKTTFMKRTFDLVDKLGIKMIKYIRADEKLNAFVSYNGISMTKAKVKEIDEGNLQKQDHFKVSLKNDGTIPEEYIKKGSGYFWDHILGELRQNFVDLPFEEAFEKLKQWEDYSVTSYCTLIKKIPFPVVKWWEAMESRSGLFDQSLAETVLASLVFIDPNTPNAEWFCFDGGSEVVHKAIVERLNVKPQHNMRVTAIKESDSGKSLTVTFNSGATEKKYSHVFSTMSFGCLRMVNLNDLHLSFAQRTAIRELMYMPSIKIGLQFKKPWWEDLGIVGGQSSTDRPIRDIVYPSYGPDSSHPGNEKYKKSNCMIAAYNGMQDSQRLGGLFKGKGTPEEKVLVDLVLSDLAAVHQVDVSLLQQELEDYYPWDFHRDQFQLGAFCHFAPGQFQYTYPHVTKPGSKDQRFHFAGDATSTFHGWVAGALNSGWRAVTGMLLAHPEVVPNPSKDTLPNFIKEWGDSEEWDQRTLEKHTYIGREITKLDLQSPNPSAKAQGQPEHDDLKGVANGVANGPSPVPKDNPGNIIKGVVSGGGPAPVPKYNLANIQGDILKGVGNGGGPAPVLNYNLTNIQEDIFKGVVSGGGRAPVPNHNLANIQRDILKGVANGPSPAPKDNPGNIIKGVVSGGGPTPVPNHNLQASIQGDILKGVVNGGGPAPVPNYNLQASIQGDILKGVVSSGGGSTPVPNHNLANIQGDILKGVVSGGGPAPVPNNIQEVNFKGVVSSGGGPAPVPNHNLANIQGDILKGVVNGGGAAPLPNYNLQASIQGDILKGVVSGGGPAPVPNPNNIQEVNFKGVVSGGGSTPVPNYNLASIQGDILNGVANGPSPVPKDNPGNIIKGVVSSGGGSTPVPNHNLANIQGDILKGVVNGGGPAPVPNYSLQASVQGDILKGVVSSGGGPAPVPNHNLANIQGDILNGVANGSSPVPKDNPGNIIKGVVSGGGSTPVPNYNLQASTQGDILKGVVSGGGPAPVPNYNLQASVQEVNLKGVVSGGGPAPVPNYNLQASVQEVNLKGVVSGGGSAPVPNYNLASIQGDILNGVANGPSPVPKDNPGNIIQGVVNGGGPAPVLNLANIQGDILPAFPKALENFYYFRITDLNHFRKVFKEFVLPKINTADDLANRPPPPLNLQDPESFKADFLGVNVGFSYLGLKLFGLGDGLGDVPFEKGQQWDSKSLGDAGTQRGDFWNPDWDGPLKEDIHGIFLIVAYNDKVANDFIKELDSKLLVTKTRSCIKKVYFLHGNPRAGKEGPNDHFGYRGGMSNPQVEGVSFGTPAQPKIRYPGSPVIPLGVIVMGYDGDEDKDKRPAWAKDGSFMVTRKLNNLVPEFDAFLDKHGPIIFPNIPPKDAALRLGARLFGRWKNGTPVELSPDNDDPSIAADNTKINNFTFDQSARQTKCPFASHMRKSNPRNDVSPVESAFRHFIRRHNMPYGEEVTDEERDGKGTIQERGLHIVCYQSSIVRGFKFIQEGWYNEPNFPPNKSVQPGYDPLFGQTGKEDQSVHRFMTGANPNYEQQLMSFPHKFIDPRGGEYFFAPSISTMKTYIAAK